MAADFTVTVQAGVRLRDLERALAPARQTVALFPPRPAYAGTMGGLIATNAAGSHRYGFGTPRDRLTGITAVRADGTIIASADHAATRRTGPGHAAGRLLRQPRADHRGHLPARADAEDLRRHRG